MTSSYFGGANAVIVAFDLTDQKTFDAVEKWIKEAQSFADKAKPLQVPALGPLFPPFSFFILYY